jgi:hyperosmotically inducible protein
MTAAIRTDEEIKKDVVNQLYWDGCIDASSVKVEVHEGEVILTGTVPNYTAYQAAGDDTWAISGVTNVRNDLIIKFPSGVKTPSDVEIKTNIENILLWQPNIDSTDIDVTVNSGWVMLYGSVDAYWKKVRAEELILGLNGVLGLTNELAIVPTERIEDKTIAEDIEAALERQFNIDQNLIDVKVENGQVTLSGSVGSLLAFRAAQRIAENTLGVLIVNNELVIR